MNGRKVPWIIAGLAAMAGALAALLAVECLHRSESGTAYGQAAEVAGSANYVLALLGNTASDATPLFVIDTQRQTIMIYEYMVSTRTLYLRVARTYMSDRDLIDNGFFGGNVNAGPNVDQVRSLVRTRR